MSAGSIETELVAGSGVLVFMSGLFPESPNANYIVYDHGTF